MPCYYPIQAWQPVYQNENGKRPPIFKFDKSTCGNEIEIPCGRCIGCRLERSRQWACRCVHESQMHEENTYLTLTYDNEHLPKNGSLDKRHFQLFMKKFRKKIQPKKIRYFMCGEYGERCFTCKLNKLTCFRNKLPCAKNWTAELARPHYHAIIFGHEFQDKELTDENNGNKYYESESLNKLWGNGNCIIGDVTFESAAYVARYITKKVNNDDGTHYSNTNLDTGELQSLIPEYVSMSRGGSTTDNNRGGIATSWYKKYKRDLDKDFITLRGIKMRPPKFYDRLQDIDEPDEYEVKQLARQEQQRIADKSDHTIDRLKVREKLKLKQTKSLKRGYENEN